MRLRRLVRVIVDTLEILYSDFAVEKPSLLFLFGAKGRFKRFLFFVKGERIYNSIACACLKPFKFL